MSELLKGVKARPLPPLDATVGLQIASTRLAKLLSEAVPALACQPSEAQFCNTLLNLATERYAGRFFPEIALHLVDGAVGRARDRILSIDPPPDAVVTVDDLWSYVSEEQGIDPATFGKNPAQFYDNLRAALKREVIGQDHAVDIVCRELEYQAERPPTRLPRGRFLFVGPPGVGKTELAKCLTRGVSGLATTHSSCSTWRNTRQRLLEHGSWVPILVTSASRARRQSTIWSAPGLRAWCCWMKWTVLIPPSTTYS